MWKLIQVIPQHTHPPLYRRLKSIYCVVSHSIYRISLARVKPKQTKPTEESVRTLPPPLLRLLDLILAATSTSTPSFFAGNGDKFIRLMTSRWRKWAPGSGVPVSVAWSLGLRLLLGLGCSLHRNHFYNWHAASQKKNSGRNIRVGANRMGGGQTGLNCLQGFFVDLRMRCLHRPFVRYDIILIEITFGLQKWPREERLQSQFNSSMK